MAVVAMKQLLEAGVHYGHQTRRWDPKMAEYIFQARNGIHIIDLQKTSKKLDEAYKFVKEQAEEEFKLFKAETVNAKNITSEEFDKNEQAFRKEYNKKLIKYKVIHIAKITLCFGLAVLFILGMVFA